MGWLEFAANIIDNVLSWPVAVLLIVLLLRKQLRELFHTVENLVLEHGGTRLSINRNLERARESVAAAKSDRELEAPKPDAAAEEAQYLADQYQHAWKLARRNPLNAIEVAWDRLIAEQVRRLAHDRGLPPADDTMHQLKELNSLGVVNDAIVNSAKSLNAIRTQVEFAQIDPSPNEALEYVDVAWEVSNYLSYLRTEDAKRQSPQ
jgi:hypothetical protein